MSVQDQSTPDLRRAPVPRWVWLAITGLAIGVWTTLCTGIVWCVPMFLKTIAVERSGDLGGNNIPGPDGLASAASPFWRRGDRLVLVGMTQYPGKPFGPGYVLLVRMRSPYGGSASTSAGAFDPDLLHVTHTLADDSGRGTLVRFHVPKEGLPELLIGTQPHSLEQGNVFLVDMRARPTAFRHLKVDLAPLLVSPKPDRADLRSLVEALQEQDEFVRKFWR